MGILDFFKRKKPVIEPKNSDSSILDKPSELLPSSDSPTEPRFPPPIPKDIPYVEKERILVKHIELSDMLQFPALPYQLDGVIHKFLNEGYHPIAYIDMNTRNQLIALDHLQQLNVMIDSYRHLFPLLTPDFFIDIGKIIFHPLITPHGRTNYSHLICTPYTTDGTVSPYPLSLFFTTHPQIYEYETHGTVFYNQHGNIAKADIYIWRNPTVSQGKAIGWFFIFRTLSNGLELYEVKSTLKPDVYGQPLPVYKHPSIIEWEQQRERDLQNYQWIQSHLPAMCPKSISGFRRMKTMNTKNYQKLVIEAEKLGKKL